MAPARSQTSIEIVPGLLPWISNWVGVVTSASAMSALVSDTRAIGDPTLSTVDRPAINWTAEGAASMAVSITGAAAALPGAAMATTAAAGTAGTCALSVVPCSTATMRIHAPVSVMRLVQYVNVMDSLLLAHDFLRALVTTDDFNDRQRLRDRGRRGRCHRHPRPQAGETCNDRRFDRRAEQ